MQVTCRSHAGHMRATCRSHAGHMQALTPSEVQCRLLVVVHEEQNNAPQSSAEGHRLFCMDTHTHTHTHRERERERERRGGSTRAVTINQYRRLALTFLFTLHHLQGITQLAGPLQQHSCMTQLGGPTSCPTPLGHLSTEELQIY